MPNLSQPELTRDTICACFSVMDTSVEQPVELDCFLPDYYPNIFKLLKTVVTPSIHTYAVNGASLVIDGVSLIRVFYLPEGSNRLCCIEQSIPFSKTVDLPEECGCPLVSLSPRCYFVNSRAVNQRRLDIRGGISIKIRVTDQREESVITGGTGGGLMCRQQILSACGSRKTALKSFTVTEDFELGRTKPPFASVLYCSSHAAVSEAKLIANKAICKGDLVLKLFYQPEGENAPPESMEFSTPISQIADLPGLNEDFGCGASFTVTGVSIEPKPDENGENKILNCEFSLLLSCVGDLNREYDLVDDAYSTLFESSLTSHTVCTEKLLGETRLTAVCRHTIETGSGALEKVLYSFASFSEPAVRLENGVLTVSGSIEASILAAGPDGMPFLMEKTFPAQVTITDGLDAGEISFLPQITVSGVSCTILSASEAEIKAELQFSGPVYGRSRFPIITDITLDEEKPKVKDALCALKLFYAEEGDTVWDIAKRFSTSVTAVMEENGLNDGPLPERTMLLIPLTDS